MSKLYFNYSTMNAGKSMSLLTVDHNYRERDLVTLLVTAAFDDRSGRGRISSRIGPSAPAETFVAETDLFAMVAGRLDRQRLHCVLVDEAQFLSETQVWQLARVTDRLDIPVMCYGLRTDFQGNLFEGSRTLMAVADEMREIRTICHCERKATMVARYDAKGEVVTEGPQIEIGGNDRYVALCRKHWEEATGRVQVRSAPIETKFQALPC